MRNGSINNFDYGVELRGFDPLHPFAAGSIVEGLRVSGVGSVGINVINGIVKGNTVTGSGGSGETGIGARASVVAGNNATSNDFGFSINSSTTNSGSTVTGNTAMKNTSVGIFVFCPANLLTTPRSVMVRTTY